MITDNATIDQNRADASALVRQQQGLSNDPSSWTYEQRVAYNKALAQYITSNPDQFDATDLKTAQTVSTANTPPTLLDTSFDWGAFGDEVINQASSINDSVNPFSEANRGKILWIAVAIGALYLLLPRIVDAFHSRKEGKAAS